MRSLMVNIGLYFPCIMHMIIVCDTFKYQKCRVKLNEIYGVRICANKYIWNRELNNFVSLLNESLLHDNDFYYSSLANETFTIVAHNFLPFISCDNHTFGGYIGEFWYTIQEFYKFKQKVIATHHELGAIMVQNGEADVMLISTVIDDNIWNVHYSQPYFNNWYHIYMKSPKGQGSPLSYVKTFTPELWIYCWGFYIILAAAIWLTLQVLKYAGFREPSYSMATCFLGVIAGIMNQGLYLNLRSLSGRIQVLFALLFGVILYSAMSAILFSQLAVFDIPFPFTDLDDIAVKKTYSLCMRNNSFVYENFTDEKNELLPKWRNVVNHNCPDIGNQDNIPKILCQEKFLVLENRAIMSAVMNTMTIPCQIAHHKRPHFIQGNVFIMKRAFRGKEAVAKFMHKLITTGILKRIVHKWEKTRKIVEQVNTKWNAITLDHTIGIIYLYTGFIVLSIMLLIVEILWYKYI